MSFLGEIKRRKVFQVAAVYLVVAWLIMQVVDVVSGPLLLPDLFARIVIVVLAIGFPISVLISWAFNLTPEGVVKDQGTDQNDGRRIEYALFGLLVLAVGFMFVDNYVLENAPEPEVVADEVAETAPSVLNEEQRDVLPDSIAVLPFGNLSPDPDNAYFAAGLHEEILSQLAKLRNLSVISRTSVLRYEDSDLSVPEIAGELNVGTIMEGSVRYADDRVRITMQLIDAETDEHLWSETYEREFADIFAIETDIATNIAKALEVEFSLAEQASIERMPTSSSAAYSFYLKALNAARIATIEELVSLQWVDDLERAISLDPEFGAAYALKALTYSSFINSDESARRAENELLAEESATRALELDPTLGIAHVARAHLHLLNRRWVQADEAFERALLLSPNDIAVLAPYSRFKRITRDLDEAIRTAQRGMELDPNEPANYYQLGIGLKYAGRYDEAIEAFHSNLEVDPTFTNAHTQLGYTDVARGNWEEAVEELTLAEQLYGQNILPLRLAQMANAYARMDMPNEAQRLFDEFQERADENPVSAAYWCLAYLAIGENAEALQWLEIAVDDELQDQVVLGEIKFNPYANPVLDERPFRELRGRIGA